MEALSGVADVSLRIGVRMWRVLTSSPTHVILSYIDDITFPVDEAQLSNLLIK
jgi:hypothetical protein